MNTTIRTSAASGLFIRPPLRYRALHFRGHAERFGASAVEAARLVNNVSS